MHIASTKVPFTSEGKEAVAEFDEITNEIILALKLCARSLKSHLNKDEKKRKTRAKFEIVQEILPQIAEKTSSYLDRPVPDLDMTISKIMNVIWVEPTVENKKKVRNVTYTIYNYTREMRTMRLHAKLPRESVNLSLFGGENFIEMNDEGKTTWELKDIPPSRNVSIKFELTGDMADTFNVDEIYISGINPVMVMGADALPGDWGIKGMEIVEFESDLITEEDEETEEAEILDDE